MKNQKGFSLIELLIVVVIIGIIAAIAIPNLLAARRSANEGSAISSLRTLHGAQMTYQATAGAGEYAGNNAGQTAATLTLGTAAAELGLVQLNSSNLVDSVLATGVKSGFNFGGDRIVSASGTPASFFFVANPVTDADGATPSNITGTGYRCFGIETEGVMRYGSESTGSAVTESFESAAEVAAAKAMSN